MMTDISEEDSRHLDDTRDLVYPGPTSSSLFSAVIASGTNVLRASAPHIVPLIVCALVVPFIVFASLLAGWLVWKNTSVGWEAPLYLQYGDGSPPYAQVLLPPLVPQQRYDISVNLVVPLTEANLALGNFMGSLTLSTPTNKTLISVRRPALILPPETSFLTFKPKTGILRLLLLQAYLPGTSKLVATVEVGRKDSWTNLGKGEGREVSILSAHIQGAVVHHGIRGLVARFPVISATLSSMAFLAVLSAALSICVLPNVLRRHDKMEQNMRHHGVGKSETSDDDILDEDNKSFRRRRSTSRHSDIKLEDEAEPTQPLRRRTSRRLERQSDTDS